MNRIFLVLYHVFLTTLCRFPTKLPVGMQAFEDWFLSICQAYGLPDDRSYKNAVSTMIMHLGPTCDRKPRAYFAKAIRKSMSNQVAYEVIEQIRNQQKAEIEAAKPQPSAEATHTTDTCESNLEQKPTA